MLRSAGERWRVRSTGVWRSKKALAAMLSDVQRTLHGSALSLDLLLQQRDGINQLLRSRRATGHVDIYGDDLIHALHQRVIVEHAARRRARAHRDHPLWLRQLFP